MPASAAALTLETLDAVAAKDLSLMKQACAFGVGVIRASQNPMDCGAAAD